MSSETAATRRFPTRIGTRLTFWGSLVTLGACAIVCGTLYAGLSFSLRREIDRFLDGEIHEFMSILNEEGNDSFQEIERDIRRELRSRPRRDLTFRLMDPSGKLVVSSDPFDSFPNQVVRRPAASASDASRFDTVRLEKTGSTIRVRRQWVDLPDRGQFEAQAVYTLDGVDASLRVFGRICAAAMLMAAGLSVFGGRWLAHRSLSPLRLMTDAVQRVRSDNLSGRLVRTGNDDELDRLAATLNEMLERLERQFKRIQQFTADAAHELRTPITALRGNAEVTLTKSSTPAELRHVLEESIEQFDRLSRIADDLLLLARADAGHDFLQRENFALDAAIHDAVDLIAPLAQEKGIALRIEEANPARIFADGARIRQVLGNLLDNALKFTPRGGNITLSLSSRNGLVELKVADTGPGIAAEHLPFIFDRFYRVDVARARKNGGTGLGLAICRTIVEAHGGHVRLDSAPGRGATAVVSLPTGHG